MALKLADLQVTNFHTPITSSVIAGLSNDDGLVVFGYWDSDLCTDLPTTASIFAPGCIMLNKAGITYNDTMYVNTGTTAVPVWTAKRTSPVSESSSLSPSRSPSRSPSASPSVSPSASLSPSASPSLSPSASLSPSISPSLSPSGA